MGQAVKRVQERSAWSSRFWAVFMSTQFAVLLFAIAGALLLAAPFVVAHHEREQNNFRVACERSGGVYVSQRFDPPLCLDSQVVHP